MSEKPTFNIFPKDFQHFLILKKFQGDGVIYKSLQDKMKCYYKKIS